MLWMWRHRSSLSDVPQATVQRGGASPPTTHNLRNSRSALHIDTAHTDGERNMSH